MQSASCPMEAQNFSPTHPFEKIPRSHSLSRMWGEPDMWDKANDIAAWFTDPPGVVTQLGKKTSIDLAVTRSLTFRFHPRVQSMFPGKKTFALHDWSTVTDFDFDARGQIIRFCMDHRADFEYTGISHPPLRPLIKLAVSVAKEALDLGSVPFRLFPNVTAGIDAFRLRRAPPRPLILL